MMAFQKLKYVALWCLALITTGGIVYGVLRDDPRRLEQGLRGRLIEVIRSNERRSVTVRLDEFEALLNLDVAPRAQIWNAYESRDFDDVRTGQYVAVRLADDHRTIRELHIVGERYPVRIDRLDRDGSLLVTEVEHDDDVAPKTHHYQLAERAILRIGGLPAAREDFHAGLIVPLELAADGRTVNAIEAEAEAETMVEGEVVNVNATQRSLIVAGEDDHDTPFELKLSLSSGAMIILDGKPGEFGSVRARATIRLRLTADRKQIRAMSVENPEVEIDDDVPLVFPSF